MFLDHVFEEDALENNAPLDAERRLNWSEFKLPNDEKLEKDRHGRVKVQIFKFHIFQNCSHTQR